MRKMLIALGIAALMPSALQAQTQLPNPGLQIQFAPPGARALGMGATFVAIADDATAAASNPAGLVILSKPEVSGQLRYSKFTTPSPFGPDVPDSEDSIGSLAFASFVYPKEKYAVGVYYQQPTNFESGSIASWTGYDGLLSLDEKVASDQRIKLENFGASLALKVAPKLSLGASVRATRVSRASEFSYGASVLALPGTSVTFTEGADGSPTKLSFDVGVLVNPNGKFSLGANYSFGPTVDIDRTWRIQRTGALVDLDHPSLEQGEDDASPFNVPDTFGVGVAFRPTDKWVVSAEVLAIRYSDLAGVVEGQEDVTDLEFEDKAELHVGGEYTLVSGKTPISLRAGYFFDPDHDGVSDVKSDQHHVTAGAGFVVNGQFQLDFAVNIAKQVKEGLVSVVLRF